MAKYTSIGGQALIEGIMMKSPEKTAIAVRMPDKSIDVTYLEEKSVRERYPILKAPILRGVAGFIESIVQGYKALMLSAEKSGFTELEDENEKPMSDKKKNVLLSVVMIVGSVLGVALAVVLFMLIPRLAVSGLRLIFKTDFAKIVRSSIEQLIKLAVFVLYVWIVSFMSDIKRVFMYHGAEHKTIFCYEKGLELTVENVRKQKRFHPRCGTSFMILMILVSIIISTVVQMIFPSVYNIAWLWVAVKILLIPIVCGVGYEILKVCGKYDNIITHIISAPGLWLQRITTKEPEDDMIEIAISALRACEPENPDVDRSVDIKKSEVADDDTDNI
ncbi:MAG: DUF1385 domain-containing protein [Clostridia bacterium]|nr:DUF1385 domain-containing protein [Clostridia bacterium]